MQHVMSDVEDLDRHAAGDLDLEHHLEMIGQARRLARRGEVEARDQVRDVFRARRGWLNPAAFTVPAAGTFGNLGRNTFFGPNFKQIDFSALKDFKLGEKAKLEYRAEFFNIFNRPNFDQPNTTFNTPNFGKIFNTFGRTLGLGTSRQIQMALRLSF